MYFDPSSELSFPPWSFFCFIRPQYSRHFLSRAGRSSFCSGVAVDAVRHDGIRWYREVLSRMVLERRIAGSRWPNDRASSMDILAESSFLRDTAA